MISIIVPAYNEQESITDTVERALAVLKDNDFEGGEVIVVDDGSDDHTGQRAIDAGAQVLTNPMNLGYGYSLKRGIRDAKNSWVAITDADGTYPIEDISKLWILIERGFHMAVGTRTSKNLNSSPFKALLRLILKITVEFVAGREIPDINSGFRIFTRDDANKFDTKLCDTFSYSTSITLAYVMNGLPVGYTPISYGKRQGNSKISLFRDSFLTLTYILQSAAFYNPFKIFLVFAGLTLASSISFFILGVILQLLTAFSIGIGLFLMTFLFIALGLVAEVLRHLLAPPSPSKAPSVRRNT